MGSMLDVALPPSAYSQYRERLARLAGIPEQIAEEDILYHVGAGLSTSVLSKLASCMVSTDRLASAAKQGGLLSAADSYSAYELAFIQVLAETIFGDEQKAHRWLSKPKERFEGKTPVQMLSQENGAAKVTMMLIQIAEGYSA